MAQQGVAVFLVYFLIYATTSSMVSAITLPNQVTPKPRHTKFSSSTTEPGSGSLVTPSSTVSKDAGVAEYRHVNSNGETCILMRTDAVVEVTFLLHDLEERVNSFIPPAKTALVDGDCTNEDQSNLRISWSDYNLVFNFEKTPGGEKWFIEKIELTVNSEKFSSLNKHAGKPVKLYHKGMLTPTRTGRSYSCAELDIDLETDEKDHPPKGIKGSLLLRLLQLQPFMYKGEDFEPAVECKPQKMYRDETAPIAVGSTLAVAVLMTVTGYAIFRYFKVKNVQYNTME